jgi:hypothetical protein
LAPSISAASCRSGVDGLKAGQEVMAKNGMPSPDVHRDETAHRHCSVA